MCSANGAALFQPGAPPQEAWDPHFRALKARSKERSGGVSVGYQYDALNRLTNVVDNRLTGSKNTGYRFDAVGNLTALTYPNGVTNLWQYDSLNRLTNLVWKLGTNTNAAFAYQLGTSGNRTRLDESVNGSNRVYQWAYDSLYRLTNEAITGAAPTGNISYKLDAVGNRTNRTSGVTGILTTNNYFDANDWLDADSTSNNGSAWFDANGNTRTNLGGTVTTLLYDWANRLTNANNAAVVITYDADGNRTKKVVGSTTTLYLVSSVNPSGYAQVVEEFTVSGGVTNLKVYTFGLDLISQRAPNSSTNFFAVDGLGSTRALMNMAGSVTNIFAYDAFGNLIASNSTPQTAYLFAGEQFDFDLGLYYNRARYLNQNAGRFISRDSFEGNTPDPLSLHKYLYAHGNPVNGVDPNGHEFTILGINVSSAITAGLSLAVWSAISTPYTANAPGPNDPLYPAITPEELLFSAGAGFVFGAGGSVAGQSLGLAGRIVAKRLPRPLARLFEGHAPGQGFSAVFDEATGRVHSKPSPQLRGAPVPEGWVARGGGHETLSLELGGDMELHRGFTMILLEDGTLETTWVSRTLNPAPNFVVPRELRPEIVQAVEAATGKIVSKPNLE